MLAVGIGAVLATVGAPSVSVVEYWCSKLWQSYWVVAVGTGGGSGSKAVGVGWLWVEQSWPYVAVVAVVVELVDFLCFVRWLLPTCDTLVKSASQGSHVGGVRASPDDPPAAQK